MLAALSRLLKRNAPVDLSHWTVTVYTRQGCGCCETAFRVLEPYRLRHRFRVEPVDVDQDPGLVEQFGLLVPVVAVNGKVRFKGKINEALLDRLIEAEK